MNIFQTIKRFFSRKKKLKLINKKETIDALINMVIDIRKNAHELEEVVMENVDNDQKFDEFGRLIAHAFKTIEERVSVLEQALNYIINANTKMLERIETIEQTELEKDLIEFVASDDSKAN